MKYKHLIFTQRKSVFIRLLVLSFLEPSNKTDHLNLNKGGKLLMQRIGATKKVYESKMLFFLPSSILKLVTFFQPPFSMKQTMKYKNIDHESVEHVKNFPSD